MLKKDFKNCIIITAYIEGSIKDILSSFCYYTDMGELKRICPEDAASDAAVSTAVSNSSATSIGDAAVSTAISNSSATSIGDAASDAVSTAVSNGGATSIGDAASDAAASTAVSNSSATSIGDAASDAAVSTAVLNSSATSIGDAASDVAVSTTVLNSSATSIGNTAEIGDAQGIAETAGMADEILRDSFILCADAGYEKALAEGIRPDLIMGDFDSLEGSLPDDIEIVTHPVHKDDTDTGLALRYALSKGFKNVTIVGGIGGRMDHTLANIQDIVGYTGKGMQVIMKDGRNMFTVLREGTHTIPRFEGHCVSQFAHGGPAQVSITGVEYPLDHHTLTCDFPLGVSNEFWEDSITLTVHDGIILLIISK